MTDHRTPPDEWTPDALDRLAADVLADDVTADQLVNPWCLIRMATGMGYVLRESPGAFAARLDDAVGLTIKVTAYALSVPGSDQLLIHEEPATVRLGTHQVAMIVDTPPLPTAAEVRAAAEAEARQQALTRGILDN